MAHSHHHSRGHRTDLVPLQPQLAQQRAVRVQRLHQSLLLTSTRCFYADAPRSQEVLVQTEPLQLRQRRVLLHQLADRADRLLGEVVVPHIQHLPLTPRFHIPLADTPLSRSTRAAPAAVPHRRGLPITHSRGEYSNRPKPALPSAASAKSRGSAPRRSPHRSSCP